MAEQDPTLGGADNPERPEWLPENFKSPEALVDSYKELQGASTRTSQQLAEERQAREALEEAVQTLSAQFEAQNQPDPNAVYSQWQDLHDNDPVTFTFQAAQRVAEQTAREILKSQQAEGQSTLDPDTLAFFASQMAAQKYEDWDEVLPQVKELMANDPIFANDNLYRDVPTAANTIDRAYRMAKADSLLSDNAVVQQQVADTRAMKLAAQSAAGASGRSPAPDDFEQRWQEIQNAQSGKLGL